MPRGPESPGKPVHHRVQVLLNDEDLAHIRTNQETSISAYLRDLVRADRGHTHKRGKLISEFTVKNKTTRTYHCEETETS